MLGGILTPARLDSAIIQLFWEEEQSHLYVTADNHICDFTKDNWGTKHFIHFSVYWFNLQSCYQTIERKTKWKKRKLFFGIV